MGQDSIDWSIVAAQRTSPEALAKDTSLPPELRSETGQAVELVPSKVVPMPAYAEE